MDEWLWSPVPRRLRVRGSVVVGQTRLPLRVFLIASGFAVAAALLVVMGAPLGRTSMLAPACALTLLLVEGSWAGRSTRAVVAVGVTHLRRPRRLRLQPRVLELPAQLLPDAPLPAIRWVDTEPRHERG